MRIVELCEWTLANANPVGVETVHPQYCNKESSFVSTPGVPLYDFDNLVVTLVGTKLVGNRRVGSLERLIYLSEGVIDRTDQTVVPILLAPHQTIGIPHRSVVSQEPPLENLTIHTLFPLAASLHNSSSPRRRTLTRRIHGL